MGELDRSHRPAVVIEWAPGKLIWAASLMFKNPTHCVFFEQHDLQTHQSRNLALVTPEFVEAAKRSKIKFEVIEEVS